MTFQVFQEDGFGNVFDENGNQPVEMDVDDVNFPLENITNYDSYMDLKPPEREININNPEETVKKKVGRHKILSDEHKVFLLQKYGDDPQATVQETMESLISQFEGLKVSKTTVYEFMTKDCALTMKKAHFEPKERNSDQSIKKRYDWAVNIRNTDMDYQSNCIFIDESIFYHIHQSSTQ
ncbi:hypothetical protein BDF14DRAFT_1739780 [Spinellus fusiger]|nr:hypothetical protein BDF14DRAFT_1746969 [Spinellus fusiger]KAI7873015.1 hypothetical protein BDF14DRAFT_1739780 [Spinellus fusiger]